MTFSTALPLIRSHHFMRRSTWQNSWIGLSPGAPYVVMFWRSGAEEKWRVTLGDVMAEDWQRITEMSE